MNDKLIFYAKKNIYNIFFLTLSIILFGLSFPGYFSKFGIPFLSFIALIPMFHIIFKLNYIEAIIYGFIFGLAKYQHFNFWFKEFDPAAYAVAPGIHGFYFLLLFLVVKYFYKKFPKYGYLAITATWFSYEVFKSTNPAKFSYGLLSQSMYKTHLFTGIVDILGSYSLSILIIFPGLLFAFLFTQRRKIQTKEWLIPGVIYLCLMLGAIVYTFNSKVDYSDSKTIKVSLIQHNLNCWLSTENSDLYIQAYDHLENLSKIAESQGADVIVWPETAFVPAIEWHKKYRPKNERERYELIQRLENYLDSTHALYIIGNNESFNIDRSEQYNSAYLFNKSNIVEKYRKIKLVPFTEEFPFPNAFPWLLEYVEKLGAKQITPGTEQTLFDLNGIKSTLLICYEDAFPDLPREGVLKGSDLMVNITNDAWTTDTATALQHLAAASLRTIETRRSLVRAGTSGFTGVIDPNGEILASLPLFTKDLLTYDVPIYNDKITFYTKYGYLIDNVGYLFLAISLLLSFIKVKTKRIEKK
ncbi:MAG: apolipoprotein N-acyltransferase [Spirochaetales bacterium]|nr:apolipoprotein N-acyltransferase [Spirochaetales bacterium]